MKFKNLVYSLLVPIILGGCSKDKDSDILIDPVTLDNPLVSSEFIDKKIESLLAEYQIPGMAVAVVSKSNELKTWSKSYGVSHQETQVAITEDTSFWLGSLSKHVMGLSLMIARDQELINLDDDVRPLLEATAGFSIANPESAPITYRHLMSHKSGIIDSDSYVCSYFINLPDGTQEMLINALEEEEICPEGGPTTLNGYLQAYFDEDGIYYSEDDNFLTSTPGSDFEYSNIGAALAGFALQIETGQTLAEFAQTALFSPLGMENTSWDSTMLNSDNIATPYSYDDESFEVFALPNYELATWPDGGLRSSVSDITELLLTIMNNGKVATTEEQLINVSSLEEMQTQTSENYGLFTEIWSDIEYAGKTNTLIGHTGSDPGAFSFMLFNEDKDIGVVIISNGDDESVDEDMLSTNLTKLVMTLFEAGEMMGKQ